MKSITLLLLVLLALPALSCAEGRSSDLYDVQLQKLKPDVYVAYRPDPLRYFVEGNVTIIINDRDVVVVDAGGSPLAARHTIAEIKRLTPKPVRYLVNTHDHVDHTLGNQEYVKAYPGVEIVAHPVTRANLDTVGRGYVSDIVKDYATRQERARALFDRLRNEGTPGYEQVIAYWERYNNGDIQERTAEYRKATITLPTLTIEHELVLHRGARTIEIRSIGHGDTPGDLIVYLPQDKIVCSGDMLTEPIPYGFTDEPLEWRKTLGRLADLDFEVLVPGHGAVQNGKAYLQRVMRLLDTVEEQVRAAVARGDDLDKARASVDLSAVDEPFTQNDPVRRYRFEGWFVKPNVGETYRVLKEQGEKK